MENWHYNFDEFIDWRHNAGDDYMRLRTANTASLLSDAFMKRVQKDEEWYMFDPKEAPELVELYGAEFEKKYEEYVKMAQNGKIKLYKKVPAKDLMKKILVSLQSTGLGHLERPDEYKSTKQQYWDNPYVKSLYRDMSPSRCRQHCSV